MTYVGVMVPDSVNTRRKYYGSAWIVNDKCAQEIPQSAMGGRVGFGRKKFHATECGFSLMADREERLEGREKMFNVGKGEVCRKRPSTYGSHRVNSPLTGMGLNMADRKANSISKWSISIMAK